MSTLVLSLFFSSFLEVAFLISLSLILYPIETQHLFVFLDCRECYFFHSWIFRDRQERRLRS